MKISQLAVPLLLAAASFGSAAKAETGYFAAMAEAQASCGADTVVWVDLDRGRYYKIGQGSFAKSNNGIYACERAAHAKYREGKSDPSELAKK